MIWVSSCHTETLWTLSVICVAHSHVLQLQSSEILSENLQDLVAFNPRDAALGTWWTEWTKLPQ